MAGFKKKTLDFMYRFFWDTRYDPSYHETKNSYWLLESCFLIQIIEFAKFPLK